MPSYPHRVTEYDIGKRWALVLPFVIFPLGNTSGMQKNVKYSKIGVYEISVVITSIFNVIALILSLHNLITNIDYF